MHVPVPKYNLRLFVLYVLGSLAAVFYLPTLVPLKPTVSASYVFGYNNRAGVVLVLLLVALGAIWTNGLGLQFLAPSKSRNIPAKTLVFALLIISICCFAMYMLAGRFGGFGESSYEIDRVWQLSQGKTPYVDFEWPFGAGLLYGPLLLGRLIHLSVVPAYYLFWGLSFLGGTVVLYLAVNLIDYPSEHKKTIFLLLFFAGLLSVVNMGTHYTFLRYSTPLLFILLVQNLLRRSDSRSQYLSVFLAIFFTALLLLISPEIAVAHAFACICVFVWSRPRTSQQQFLLLPILAVALAVVLGIASKFHVFATMKASGGGADSFPIGFAPHILLFFAALFLCACYLFRRLSVSSIHDNTIGLIAFSIPMMAAALGRCDLLHVVWNAQGIFLASLIYASNLKRGWKWCRTAYLLFAIVYPGILSIQAYAGQMATIASEQLRDRGDNSHLRSILINLAERTIQHFPGPDRRSSLETKLVKAERPAVPQSFRISSVYPSWHGRVFAPAGYRPHGDGFGSDLSDDVDYGYFEGFENANTTDALQEKLTELKNRPGSAILLPASFFDNRCKVNPSGMRRGISLNWGFPYIGRAVHVENVRKPVCDYIQSQYVLEDKPTLDNFDYGLWVNKASDAH